MKVSFRFFISLPNGKEMKIDETDVSFQACLEKAVNEANFVGGQIKAWNEIEV